MPGKTAIAISVLALSLVSFCSGQDYFPLQLNNQWIYKCAGACGPEPTLQLEITGTQQFGDQRYFRLHGWRDRDFWLRQDDGGRVFAYDPEKNEEQLWYAFQTAEGETYTESLPACCGKATIAFRAAKYQGPVGSFENALEIRYPGVFQVGIYQEQFLPYVGMAHRSEGRGGPAVATYDLIYARLGDVTVISQPELAVSLTLDQSVYKSGAQQPPVMTALLSVRNTTADLVALTFNTGQIYDLEIRNEKGEQVFLWSKGKLFAQIVQSITFASGEKNYVITAPLALPPGKYIVQGWLVAGPPKAYSVS